MTHRLPDYLSFMLGHMMLNNVFLTCYYLRSLFTGVGPVVPVELLGT